MAQDDRTARAFVPYGTLVLVLVLVAVFLMERRLAPASEASALNFSPVTLARAGAIVPAYVDAGQWWRFFTAPLLHQGLGPLTNNGIALLLSGFVERRMGWRWYLLTFAVGASLGALATYLRLPPTVVATGASGGILALFAAGLIQSLFAPDRRIGLAILCALILALGLVKGDQGPFAVDRVAHVAGMIGGAAMGILIVAYWNAETAVPNQATAVLIALGAYVAATVASLAIDAVAATTIAPPSNLAQSKIPNFPPISMPPIAPPLPITPAPGRPTTPAETKTTAFQPITPVPVSPAPPIAAAAVPAAPRTSIPVELKTVDEQGGERVYMVQVRYGSKMVDSVLDTEDGATQILPGQLIISEFSPTSTTHSMTYGFGGSYWSQLVQGKIGIGPLAGPGLIGLVGRAGCAPHMPKCAIADEPTARANFGYDTYPASLGVAPNANPAYPSVLEQLGVRRTLFIAPRRDATGKVEPGQLVLNPTDDEARGFVPLTFDPTPKMMGAVHGCMLNLTNNIQFCGAILFDSDFSGIEVYQQKDLPKRRDWSTGDKVKLMFTDARNTRVLAGVDFTIGIATLPVVRFGTPGLYADPVIRIGQVPYLGLEVLTDLSTGHVSVAARKTQGPDAIGHVP